MSDISLLNYFGTFNDFENLKKWFRINSELYNNIIVAVKERSDLEIEYSSRLSKINAKIIKTFSQSFGSIATLWGKAGRFMNEESDAHKTLGLQILDELYKPLIQISDEYNKSKKPIENDIDKCIKSYQEKCEEECKLKKKAFLATKETEKAYECSEEYKISHPSAVAGFDKEKSKIEKRAVQCLDLSMKTESEYIDSSLRSESARHKWEQSYISGLNQLQSIETDRLNSMKNVIESYHKCISRIPIIYVDVNTRLLREINTVSIRDDLFANCMHYTNKNPNIYKTEQLMLDFYAESKDNKMDMNRRKENLMKHINMLHQYEIKSNSLRSGILKMLDEEKSQFANEITRNKAQREYSKAQCQMNLLSSNLYKIQLALSRFDRKPEPTNPLIAVDVKIQVTTDRNDLVQSVLESKPGTILPFYDPGTITRSESGSCSSFVVSSVYDGDYDFDDSSDTEPPLPQRKVTSQKSTSSSNSSTKGITMSRVESTNSYDVSCNGSQSYSTNSSTKSDSLSRLSMVVSTKFNDISRSGPQNIPIVLPKPARPLPMLPAGIQCQALHDFVGRDAEELSFKAGDIINIKNKVNDVWWECELYGRIGLVPTNYVKELS